MSDDNLFAARTQDAGGFSLLEVLVAFLILVVSLFAAYQYLLQVLETSRRSQELLTALLHSRSHLSVLLAAPGMPPARSSGSYTRGLAWELEAVSLPSRAVRAGDLPPLPRKVLVRLHVYREGRRLFTLSTLAVQPLRGR